MSKGIYQYIDLKNNDVIYVGKDSYIDIKNRFYAHKSPLLYDKQPFNRVLQNNSDRYKYEVVCEADHYSEVYLNCLEKGLIKSLTPKFNFTDGGDGCIGYKHTEESCKKMSESMMGENNPNYGEKFSVNYCSKLSKSRNTTGYFRVTKHQNRSTCEQGFSYDYQYYENGKRKVLSSVNIDKLKEKVLAKGLEWIEFNKECF